MISALEEPTRSLVFALVFGAGMGLVIAAPIMVWMAVFQECERSLQRRRKNP